MSREGLRVVVRGVPKTWELRPGDSLTIGRKAGNDITLPDASVSRLHAVLEWLRGEQTPHVVDKGSTNGVFIDEFQVDGRAIITPGAVVDVGAFQLVFERLDDNKSALIEDSSEIELNLGGETPIEEGELTSTRDLENLLLHIGDLERTGTLEITLSERSRAALQFYEGQIVSVELGNLSGKAALELLSNSGRGKWAFYTKVKLTESSMNVSTRKWVNTRRMKRPKLD